MKLTPGRIVHYQLSQPDCEAILHRRADRALAGNPVNAGDIYPAFIVRAWNDTTANLRVLLDGYDDYWATSRAEGVGPGQWQWPTREEPPVAPPEPETLQ